MDLQQDDRFRGDIYILHSSDMNISFLGNKLSKEVCGEVVAGGAHGIQVQLFSTTSSTTSIVEQDTC